MTAHYGKVAVLMGGNSAEREVSLVTGAAVLAALRRQGVGAVGMDIESPRAAIARLEAEPVQRVFIALHGRGGEDGVMQALLESLGLPYTGSGVLASALAMDKHMTKQVWRGVGLPTPAAEYLTTATDWGALAARLGLPLMLKPSHEGSSVGMSKVTRAEDLAAAWERASGYDAAVLAEAFISGQEYTVAILHERALPPIRLETPQRAFYDYDAKYHDDHTVYHCPCGLPPEPEHALKDLALRAFRAVGGRGWGRVDLMRDQAGQFWLLEVNTVPGMTSHSLVPMAAKAAGLEFDALVLEILRTSLPA